MPRWWNGRHATLRSLWAKARESSNLFLGTIVYKADYIFIDFGCIKSNHSVYTIDSLNIFTDRSITWQY